MIITLNIKKDSIVGAGYPARLITFTYLLLSPFFMPRLQVQLVPTPAHHNGRLRDYSTKVKQPTGFIRAISSKMIKKPFKRHLLKPCAFDGTGGFYAKPECVSRASGPTIRGGFIMRGCFL